MAPRTFEWYWHHLHIYLHKTGNDTAVIHVTAAVVIVMVRTIAEESKSGSSGDVDDSDKRWLCRHHRNRREEGGFGSVSPLDQHGNVFNHKPKCLFHITSNISTFNTRIKEMQEGKQVRNWITNKVNFTIFLEHNV